MTQMRGGYCSRKVLNNRETKLDADERMMKFPNGVGILNICGGNIAKDFQFRCGCRRSRAESRGHAFRTLSCSNGLLKKPQARLLENIKTWDSVQASDIPMIQSICYNGNQVGTSVYHTAREGETLTSIARQYNTTVQKIAVVNNIDNIDVLQTGQLLVVPVHPKRLGITILLNLISSKIMSSLNMYQVPNGTMDFVEISPKDQNMMPVLATPAKLSMPIMPFTHHLWLVKASASFVVLASVLAYFIKGWLDSIQLRTNMEVLEQQTQKEKQSPQVGPKLMRWQGILEGDGDADGLDNFPVQGHSLTDCQENQSQDVYEEICQSYAELEPEYLKFLAESGLSKSGYWRGGLPSVFDDNIR